MRRTAIGMVIILLLTFFSAGCGHSGGVPDPDKIVPEREALIENLKGSGYAVSELPSVEGLGISVDRVFAQNGDRFIDIVYGASAEEASEIFEAFCGLYPDDYYILARNGNYVYCVSDKTTFSKAGFKSTDNVGVQYIHE